MSLWVPLGSPWGPRGPPWVPMGSPSGLRGVPVGIHRVPRPPWGPRGSPRVPMGMSWVAWGLRGFLCGISGRPNSMYMMGGSGPPEASLALPPGTPPAHRHSWPEWEGESEALDSFEASDDEGHPVHMYYAYP